MTSSLFDLNGKVALITGSSRGIGKAIAEAMAKQGANVVISSRKAAACDAVAREINSRGQGKAISLPASISDKAALQQLVDESRKQLGAIDILVCNAASNPYHGPMSGMSDEQFEKILRNNVMASHWLAAMVAPEMVSRGQGSMIFISSMGGFRGSKRLGAYNLSKAADFQLARNLAVEYGGDGVRVNCIAPGVIRTDFSRALWEDEANLAKALVGTPLNRIGEPEDVAGAAVFLASDASRYITGETIVVDGGSTVTLAGI